MKDIFSKVRRRTLACKPNFESLEDRKLLSSNSTGSIVDEVDPGYAESGPWSGLDAFGSGYGSNYRYAASGDGTSTATWEFSGLSSGSYEVEVTWTAHANRASDAPYRVYEGPTLVGTVRVDQRGWPTGASVGGVSFQGLGRFRLSGTGALRVVLGNDADGFVIADAVRVVAASIATGVGSDLNGRPLFPADNPWNQDISRDPVDRNSDAILAAMGLDKSLHPDFGTVYNGVPAGIPFTVVPGDQAKVPLTFYYADSSDLGPYPIPPDVAIEGGTDGASTRDRIESIAGSTRSVAAGAIVRRSAGGWRRPRPRAAGSSALGMPPAAGAGGA